MTKTKKCRTCKWFDLEAARLGGKNIKSDAAVECSVPRELLELKHLSSIPPSYEFKLPEKLFTCANYGHDCDFWES